MCSLQSCVIYGPIAFAGSAITRNRSHKWPFTANVNHLTRKLCQSGNAPDSWTYQDGDCCFPAQCSLQNAVQSAGVMSAASASMSRTCPWSCVSKQKNKTVLNLEDYLFISLPLCEYSTLAFQIMGISNESKTNCPFNSFWIFRIYLFDEVQSFVEIVKYLVTLKNLKLCLNLALLKLILFP